MKIGLENNTASWTCTNCGTRNLREKIVRIDHREGCDSELETIGPRGRLLEAVALVSLIIAALVIGLLKLKGTI